MARSKGKRAPSPEEVTMGEELYLVHLKRVHDEPPSADDYDYAPPSPTSRKRSCSAGEELWNVHLKRSRGMEPDLDLDPEEKPAVVHEVRVSRYNLRQRSGGSKGVKASSA